MEAGGLAERNQARWTGGLTRSFGGEEVALIEEVRLGPGVGIVLGFVVRLMFKDKARACGLDLGGR